MKKRMQVHFKTGIVARFSKETPQGTEVHEVSTTTRHAGYDVSTTLAGFIDPRSLATFATEAEAVAEARRRASGETAPVLTDAQKVIVTTLTDPVARQRTIDDLGAYWAHLFQTEQHDDAASIARLVTTLRSMGEA